ncbi:hypothetical protein GS930_10860 [Rhodococcus hoagii]|nr:hypothetical protein [Prescottella equi]
MITTESTPDLYRRLAAAFTDRVDAVPADRWEAASPCEGWTARDVLTHVVETQSHMVGVVGLSIPDGPSPRTIRLRRGGTPATPCRRSWTTPRRPRSSTTGTSGAPIWPPRCAPSTVSTSSFTAGTSPGGGARRDDPRRRSRPARRRRRAVGRFAPYGRRVRARPRRARGRRSADTHPRHAGALVLTAPRAAATSCVVAASVRPTPFLLRWRSAIAVRLPVAALGHIRQLLLGHPRADVRLGPHPLDHVRVVQLESGPLRTDSR